MPGGSFRNSGASPGVIQNQNRGRGLFGNPLSAIGGTLLSSVLGGLFGIGSTIAQNAYNSPKAQLRRLRKAGLPQAYMYQGRVNQQTDAPKLSIDPDLGTVEQQTLGIQRGQLKETQRMNDQEIDNLKEALEKVQMENELLSGNLKWQKETYPDYMGTGKPDRTNQELLLDMDKSIKSSTDWVKQNQGRISEILAGAEEEFSLEGGQLQMKRETLSRVVSQIAHLATQDKLLGQLYNIRSIEEALNEEIGGKIKDMDDLKVGILWAIMKLFDKTKF